MATAVDILTYMLPDPTWAASNHLAVAGQGGQPLLISDDIGHSRFWEMKGESGYPWDMQSYDAEFVYQSITENVWTVPTTYKIFASKSWPNGNGGIAWAPRYITPGGFNLPILTPDSTYRIYTACGTFTSQTLGGPVETKVEGPYSINFGGTIGTQTAIVQTYSWGAAGTGYENREVNYYVQGFGHVQWQLWTLVGGVYTLKQTSAFTSITAGGVPAVDFPCGVPVI